MPTVQVARLSLLEEAELDLTLVFMHEPQLRNWLSESCLIKIDEIDVFESHCEKVALNFPPSNLLFEVPIRNLFVD